MILPIKPIGTIHSCFPDKFGVPRQSGLVREAQAKIQILPEFQPAQSLQGLESFTHLWVLFWFHQNSNARFHAKVHPPRRQGESVGVFASRSPHRPNPIGLSLVEIVALESDAIIVCGIDVVSGTPVLDLKPYLPDSESIPTASRGWTAAIPGSDPMADPIEVLWSPESFQQLQAWSARKGDLKLKTLIEKTLQLDPRPLVYRGYEQQESPYRTKHAVRFYDGDVHFQFITAKIIQVLSITF